MFSRTEAAPYPHRQDHSYPAPPPPPPPPPSHSATPSAEQTPTSAHPSSHPQGSPYSHPPPQDPYYARHDQHPPPSTYPPPPGQVQAPQHTLDPNPAYRRQDHWPPPGAAPPPPSAHPSAGSGAAAPPAPAPPPQPPTTQTNGVYHPPHPAPPSTTLPPLTDHRNEMALHPPPPPPYRMGPPHHDPYARGYPPPPDAHRQTHMYPPQPQPAPRQRTAIACRYCRRRKIRCSGFESEDGRCSNCQRFSQECVFTPVASQAQAFVPAHTVYNRGNGQHPVQLYGAYGQPIRPEDVYGPRAPAPAYSAASPTAPYAGAPPPAYAPPPPPHHYESTNGVATGRKRPASDNLPPSLPPPNPGKASALPRTLAPDLATHDYKYADPVQAHAPPPPPPHNYYPSQPPPPPRRASPVTSYAHDGSRSSASPNTLATSNPPGSNYLPPYPGSEQLPPPNGNAANAAVKSEHRSPVAPLPLSLPSAQPAAISSGGQGLPRTPPGSHAPHISPVSQATSGAPHGPLAPQANINGRPGMSISSIVSGDSAKISSTDIDSAMKARLGNK